MKEENRKLAKYMHDIYEEKAKQVGWNTQESTKVEFEDLPESNKEVMLYMAKQLLQWRKKWGVELLDKVNKAISSERKELPKYCDKYSDNLDVRINFDDGFSEALSILEIEINKLKQQIETGVEG